MDSPEKDESPPSPPAPSDRPSSFPLELIDKIARQDASQKRSDKNSGISLSIHAPTRTQFTGKKEPQIIENPWRSCSPASAPHTGEEEGSTVPEPTASDSVIPAEKGVVESRNETTASEDSREMMQTGKPTSLMEVFMAAKKKGRSSKKSSASIAMGNALDRQEKKSSAIEKMLDKNITIETSRARARASRTKPKPMAKRPLADIVSEVASRKEKRKSAPGITKVTRPTVKAVAKARVEPKKAAPAPAARAARPKPRPQAKPPRAPSDPVEVVVESLASGLLNMLGDAVDGVIGAEKAVSTGAKYVAGGTKRGAEKARKTAKPGRDEKAEKDEGPVAAAAKTATRVTKNAADGLLSVAAGAVRVAGRVIYGVATVAGYTVKGSIAIVSDTASALINTAGGLLNMVVGPKRKDRKTA